MTLLAFQQFSDQFPLYGSTMRKCENPRKCESGQHLYVCGCKNPKKCLGVQESKTFWGIQQCRKLSESAIHSVKKYGENAERYMMAAYTGIYFSKMIKEACRCVREGYFYNPVQKLEYCLSTDMKEYLKDNKLELFEQCEYYSHEAEKIVKNSVHISIFDTGFTQSYLVKYLDDVYYVSISNIIKFIKGV